MHQELHGKLGIELGGSSKGYGTGNRLDNIKIQAFKTHIKYPLSNCSKSEGLLTWLHAQTHGNTTS